MSYRQDLELKVVILTILLFKISFSKIINAAPNIFNEFNITFLLNLLMTVILYNLNMKLNTNRLGKIKDQAYFNNYLTK